MATMTTPASLPWTGDNEADRLIAIDPNALLIGFALDQQVTVQKAFSGPLEIKRRLGPARPGQDRRDRSRRAGAAVPRAARHPPLPGRHGAAGAGAVRGAQPSATAATASRVWTRGANGADLQKRLAELPGIGDMKVRSLTATLVKQFGVRPDGYREVLPNHPTLGDVDSAEALAAYQAGKRAHKAAKREARPPMIIERSMHAGWLSNSYLVGDEAGGTARADRLWRPHRAADRGGREARPHDHAPADHPCRRRPHRGQRRLRDSASAIPVAAHQIEADRMGGADILLADGDHDPHRRPRHHARCSRPGTAPGIWRS